MSRLGFGEISGFTKIKIHAHPGLPPMPSILMIAAANKPENAPVDVSKQ